MLQLKGCVSKQKFVPDPDELKLTVIVMSRQVFSVNEQVMILVQFPEFAINDIKVLITKEFGDLINIILLL